ncbi:MAG TPA: TonB-dependent receptor [Candidatus Polarisedimenticolaceae bacterium]|nr:TonB-dependent receptor [Candidatus Polarisedimenticolaceae bacterium]
MRLACLAACLVLLGAASPPPRLQDLTLEELANIEVTTPGKTPESAFRTPAAVYVLTQDEIRRSGATNIPEALRLVPGVEVSRIDSYKWAIGIRGFATRLSKGVLVLIDGRSVYTPLFAGVYWEAQDVPLQDVERVEVIRGPGATIWGPNALNGVINIVTRPASQTQGFRATLIGGNVERAQLIARYGGASAGGNLHYRTYVKGIERGPQWHPDGVEFDEGEVGGAGARLDWTRSPHDTLTLQSELYTGHIGNRLAISTYNPPSITSVDGKARISGGHVMGHWNRRMEGGSELRMQAYYDRTERHDFNFAEDRDTVDLDFVHLLPLGRHRLTWGLGARFSRGDFTPVVETVLFTPEDATDKLYSGFLQDEMAFAGRWGVTLGAKFLDHNLSGFEVQPSVRLAFTPSARQTFWAAVTRAVRTPSRVDTDLSLTALLNPNIPFFLRLQGDPGFEPERILGYEAGYNQVLGERLTWSLAAFYNGYDDLLGIDVHEPEVEAAPAPPHLLVPIFFGNELRGRTKGVEITPTWNAASWLRFKAAYSYLAIELVSKPGHNDPTTINQVEGSSPKHRFMLQSLVDLPHDTELDVIYRNVGGLPYQEARAYDTADVGLTWGGAARWTFSLVGRNLFDAHHKEFGSDGGPDVEVRRSYYARVTFRP